MDIRIKILLVVGGGILAFFGFQEYRLGKGAAKDPVPVDLAQLEQGGELPNVHVKLGEHLCLYTECVYNCELKSGESEPGPDAKINFVYFPVISQEHPWFKKASAAVMRYGGQVDAVPDKEWPPVEKFSVLVKSSDRFTMLSAIPAEWTEGSEVTGMVMNRIRKLKGEERDLVQQSFPKADLDTVLILEEGRKPKAAGVSLSMMGGGVLLALLGIGWMLGGARS